MFWMRRRFSFRLQGLRAVFDVHVLGNSQLLKMCILTTIERMCVCAFLPVRVRELVFRVTVFCFIMGFLYVFLHVTENILCSRGYKYFASPVFRLVYFIRAGFLSHEVFTPETGLNWATRFAALSVENGWKLQTQVDSDVRDGCGTIASSELWTNCSIHVFIVPFWHSIRFSVDQSHPHCRCHFKTSFALPASHSRRV